VRVLAALPVDARLRCAEVCKTWFAAVMDRSLWLRVDLSRESGLTQAVTPSLLRAVSARAAGHMQALVLNVSSTDPGFNALLDLLQANRASLRELELVQPVEEQTTHSTFEEVERVLRAAPQLQVYRTDVEVLSAHILSPTREAMRMLRNEEPFGPLRMHSLLVTNNHDGGNDHQAERIDDADLLALFAAMSEHASSLKRAWLQVVPLDVPAVLDAFIDAALARRFSDLDLIRCNLSPASIPAFVRLLGGGALISLSINGGHQAPLFDAPAAALLGNALRANTTLCTLQLKGVFLWADAEAGVAVMTALTAHPSLQRLNLANNHVGDAAAVGAALGALIAANAPALHTLYVSHSALGDAGLAPLFDALPRNTHLRTLRCNGIAISAAFSRDTFLPAIRANTSLRELEASAWWGGEEGAVAPDEVLQAEALVKARADADAAAASAAA
jgi:hypothetical protein